jgi:hypothetical protein
MDYYLYTCTPSLNARLAPARKLYGWTCLLAFDISCMPGQCPGANLDRHFPTKVVQAKIVSPETCAYRFLLETDSTLCVWSCSFQHLIVAFGKGVLGLRIPFVARTRFFFQMTMCLDSARFPSRGRELFGQVNMNTDKRITKDMLLFHKF